MWKKAQHTHTDTALVLLCVANTGPRARTRQNQLSPRELLLRARRNNTHQLRLAGRSLFFYSLARSRLLRAPPLYARNPRTHACEYCKLYTRSSLGHYIVARQRCARSTVLYRDILPARDVSIRENVWATLSGGEELASEGTAGRFAGANAALVCAPEQRQMRCGSEEEEMLFDRFFLF